MATAAQQLVEYWYGESLLITDSPLSIALGGPGPTDIAGWTLAFYVSATQGGVALVTKTPAITDHTNGIFTVTLSETDLAVLTPDRYWYDVWRIGTGVPSVLTWGQWVVKPKKHAT